MSTWTVTGQTPLQNAQGMTPSTTSGHGREAEAHAPHLQVDGQARGELIEEVANDPTAVFGLRHVRPKSGQLLGQVRNS